MTSSVSSSTRTTASRALFTTALQPNITTGSPDDVFQTFDVKESQYVCKLFTLSASSGERLRDGTVAVCSSVCLSVSSIDSKSNVLQLGGRRQISINIDFLAPQLRSTCDSSSL